MSDRPLSEEWDAQAEAWTSWARTPGHDSHFEYNWPSFLGLVPAAGRATLDLGCGEGRGGVALRELGHRMTHPFASAHLGRSSEERRSYFDVQRTVDEVERDGLALAFHQIHRPLESWIGLFLGAGFVLDALGEPRPTEAGVRAVPRLADSRAKPVFLHIRCVR